MVHFHDYRRRQAGCCPLPGRKSQRCLLLIIGALLREQLHLHIDNNILKRKYHTLFPDYLYILQTVLSEFQFKGKAGKQEEIAWSINLGPELLWAHKQMLSWHAKTAVEHILSSNINENLSMCFAP